MPPILATIVFTFCILGLFVLDREPMVRTSPGLWLPVMWLLINGSRPVSMWVQSQTVLKMQSASGYLEGSPAIDLVVCSGLLAAGLMVLASRKVAVDKLLRVNPAILLFFTYCAVSVLWSDYSGVAFRRWTKAVTDLVMVLIVLTDHDPLGAVKRLVARVGFVLVPVSILLIKYYPSLGRIYNIWTWTPMYVGVTDHKNTLGMVCMVLGLGFVWRLLLAYQKAEDKRRTKRLVAYAVLIAMVTWLFIKANSVTAQSCFMLGAALLIATGVRAVARKRWLAYLLGAALVAIPFSVIFLGIGGSAIKGMGRDATLTGRADIWRLVLSMSGNPMIGAGFESFWLGPRADRIWHMYYFHPTQAHNGYIEIYLELGWIGIILLAAIIVTGYRNAVATLRWNLEAGRIRMAYIAVVLAYNMTEAGFRMITLTWFFFLVSAMVVPKPSIQEATSTITTRIPQSLDEWPSRENSMPDFVRSHVDSI